MVIGIWLMVTEKIQAATEYGKKRGNYTCNMDLKKRSQL
jgi:hypothetical protein